MVKINLKKLMYYRAKGLKNKEIAKKLNVSNITISRNLEKLKKMNVEEFKNLFKELFCF